MNKTPSILVDTGFEVDQNGVLTEITIPKVVTTLNEPGKVTFMGQTLNWIPSTQAALQELDCPYCTSFPSNLINGYDNLTTVNLPSVTTLSVTTGNNYNIAACARLININLNGLTSITCSSGNTFSALSSLGSISLPSLTAITSSSAVFYKCGALTNVTMPKLQSSTGVVFHTNTSMTNLQLGSDGHPVQSLDGGFLYNCTQAGLTVTIYTNGGASLAGEPWGATNADIEYEEA